SRGCRFTRCKLVQVPIGNRQMPASAAQWPDDGPAGTVEHDLRADQSVREDLADAAALVFRCITVLAQAVAQQATEQGLAPAVADALIIGRPDDVEAGAECDVPDDLPARLLPDYEAAHPQARTEGVRRWPEFELLSKELMLPRHRPNLSARSAVPQQRCPSLGAAALGAP